MSSNNVSSRSESFAHKHNWVRPACVGGAAVVVSIAGVKIAKQVDGAAKLRGFAAVLGAVAALAKAT